MTRSGSILKMNGDRRAEYHRFLVVKKISFSEKTKETSLSKNNVVNETKIKDFVCECVMKNLNKVSTQNG